MLRKMTLSRHILFFKIKLVTHPAASDGMGDDLVSLEFSGSKGPAEEGHFLILVAGKKAPYKEEIFAFDVLREVGNGAAEARVSVKLNKQSTTTTTKPFVPSIWGRLHEPKENYAGSGIAFSTHSYRAICLH